MTVQQPTSTSLTLTLFGPMQILVQGRSLPRLRSRKAQWLLALLALRHGRPVQREWLAGMLWPDVDQSQAFANLRPILSELRRALDAQGDRLQSSSRQTLSLDLTDADVDLLAFDAAIESGKLPALEQAVALYRGPLLEGCTEEWVFQEREQREQSCLQALQTLGDSARTTGDHEAAIRFYQRAISLDPWSDSPRRGWMEALAESGDTNAALQVYREFVQLLQTDPTAAPDEQTTALYARLRTQARQRAGTQTCTQAVVSTQSTPERSVSGYLPHPLTELVGREDERDEVVSRLRRSRLVTLTGPGGIGKTRLAVAIARHVVRDYPDGVWLVSLEALTDGNQVAQQIASVMGLREQPGRPLLESLTGHIREKRLLLVQDNCEHLLTACAQVAASLLTESSGLRILATSREAMGVTGESVRTVSSLAVPDPLHLPSGQATLLRVMMAYEGVQLFVERGQAVQKSFSLTGTNALIVAEICWRLEGIPLALELAAARVKALSVEQIAERLNDHLGLLVAGSRTALPRQQTLRATLDWSYALLSEPEQVLLRRLSVFAGGWSLEAAQAVAWSDGVMEWWSDGRHQYSTTPPLHYSGVLHLLTSLVEKSLIVFEEREPDAGGRYRMLEMVRQYAMDKLEARGETEQVKARHRDWLVALAEEAEPQLKGADQEIWLRRLDAEHDNLQATLSWSGAEAQRAGSDLRLTGALYRFWYVRGYWNEGREHLGRVLAWETAKPRTAARAKALNEAGALAYSQADYEAAREILEEGLSIYRDLEDAEGIASSLNYLGNLAYDRGDFASARGLYEESLWIRRKLGDTEGIARSLGSLGNLAHPLGDYEAAWTLYEESLEFFKRLGDRQGMARTLSCLGYVAFDRGEYAVARTLYEESLNLFRELNDRGGVAWSLSCLGYLAYEQGEYEIARSQLEDGMNRFKELGDRRGVAWSLNSLGNVAHHQGERATARAFHEESLSIRRRLGDRQGIAWSLSSLGNVIGDQGEYASAQALLTESMTIFRELGDRKGVAESLDALAVVMMKQSEARIAARLWGAAQALRGTIGAPSSPRERERLQQSVAEARSALGEEAFSAAVEAGRSLTMGKAVEEALGRQVALNASGEVYRSIGIRDSG